MGLEKFALSLPEDVVQPLFSASSSSSLEEALHVLIESAKTGSGRSDLASKKIISPILKLVGSICLPSGRQHLVLSLKLLRNLCAGEGLNQDAFVDQDGVGIISDVIMQAMLGSDADCEIVRFGLQVISNVALAGEKHQAAIWGGFFTEKFATIAKMKKREACDPLCKVVYICFDGSSRRAAELCNDQGLNIVAEIVRTASAVDFGEDWLKLLLSRLCVEDGHFASLYSKLYRVGSSEGGVDKSGSRETYFSPEHAFFLKAMTEIVNERIREIMVPRDTALFLFGIFKRSIEILDFNTSVKSGLPTGSVVIDVMGYSLTILRDICAGDSLEDLKSENSEDVVDALLRSGLIELLLVLLRDLEPPAMIRKAMKQSRHADATSSCPSRPCLYKGFRRDLVSVIGNCAYRRKLVQHEIRERNGLLLMLQQCVTDEDNSFLREWGIWCIRNLLEGNEENQRAVSELEIQGSVDVPELAGIGLKVEVDPKTRRPKLVNTTSS